MNPTIKRIVEERAKEYTYPFEVNLKEQRLKALWPSYKREQKEIIQHFVAGAEQNAPMIYAQAVSDVIELLMKDENGLWRSDVGLTGAAVMIKRHFKTELEHFLKGDDNK